jgi:hypothetical protein
MNIQEELEIKVTSAITVDESSFEQVKPFQHFQYSSKLIVE